MAEPTPASAIRGPRFDDYLRGLARRLSTPRWKCLAIVPEIDGGLLLVVRDDAGRTWRLAVALEPAADTPAAVGSAGDDAPPELTAWLAERLGSLVSRGSHPLLAFTGQDVEEVVLVDGRGVPTIWQHYLHADGPLWGGFSLCRAHVAGGSLELVLSDGRGRVVLRLSNASGLGTLAPVLKVNALGLTLVADDRTAEQRECPSGAVERFVAYVIAHTTGPRMRLGSATSLAEDVLLQGRDVLVNPFSSDAQQGASGMMACLFGKPKSSLAVLPVGDAACRLTLPTQDPLRDHDAWSYFPVHTAPGPGASRGLDYGERDLVLGVEERLVEAIEELEPRRVKVAVVQTCVSRLTGEDLDAVLRSRLPPGHYVVLDPDFQGRDCGVDGSLWKWAFACLRPTHAPAKRPDTVSLVGFGHMDSPAVGELTRLLGRLGIAVLSAVFPSFDEHDLEAFDESALVACMPSSQVRTAFAEVRRQDTRNRWREVPAPFGWEGTRRFLGAVVREIRGGEGPVPGLDGVVESADEGLARAKAAFAGTRVAVAASGRRSSFIFEAPDLYGIPLVPVVAEMGGVLEAHVLADGWVPADLFRMAETGAGFELAVLGSRDAFFTSLRESQARLLLTSIPRNRFIPSLGMAPLRATDFEMGFQGAERTAERLVALARLPFLTRHRRFLQQ